MKLYALGGQSDGVLGSGKFSYDSKIGWGPLNIGEQVKGAPSSCKSGAAIITRPVADQTDAASAALTGDAGDVTLRAANIQLNSGSPSWPTRCLAAAGRAARWSWDRLLAGAIPPGQATADAASRWPAPSRPMRSPSMPRARRGLARWRRRLCRSCCSQALAAGRGSARATTRRRPMHTSRCRLGSAGVHHHARHLRPPRSTRRLGRSRCSPSTKTATTSPRRRRSTSRPPAWPTCRCKVAAAHERRQGHARGLTTPRPRARSRCCQQLAGRGGGGHRGGGCSATANVAAGAAERPVARPRRAADRQCAAWPAPPWRSNRPRMANRRRRKPPLARLWPSADQGAKRGHAGREPEQCWRRERGGRHLALAELHRLTQRRGRRPTIADKMLMSVAGKISLASNQGEAVRVAGRQVRQARQPQQGCTAHQGRRGDHGQRDRSGLQGSDRQWRIISSSGNVAVISATEDRSMQHRRARSTHKDQVNNGPIINAAAVAWASTPTPLKPPWARTPRSRPSTLSSFADIYQRST